MRWRSDYIEGVVREPEGFVVVINVAEIFSRDDIDATALAAAA